MTALAADVVPEKLQVRLFTEAVQDMAFKPLTERQLEVAYLLVVERLNGPEVARRLHITVKTVEAHKNQIQNRLLGYAGRPIAPQPFALSPLAIEFWKRVGAYEERTAWASAIDEAAHELLTEPEVTRTVLGGE